MLLTPQLTSAQNTGTIQGVVVEGMTDEPIPGANVIIDELGIGEATDIDGAYAIENVPAGPYTLAVSFIGFRRYQTAVEVTPGEIVTQNIDLVEDRLGLEEVVVTGQGAAVETRRLSTTIEVITPRQIEDTPATRTGRRERRCVRLRHGVASAPVPLQCPGRILIGIWGKHQRRIVQDLGIKQ